MKPTKETFEKWNEELAAKHDLDKFYNHPNFAFRYIEQKRIRKLIELADIKPLTSSGSRMRSRSYSGKDQNRQTLRN